MYGFFVGNPLIDREICYIQIGSYVKVVSRLAILHICSNISIFSLAVSPLKKS